MKTRFLSLFTFIAPMAFALLTSAQFSHAGSWYFNENGGFGIYQPSGWGIDEVGRSALLVGPANDEAQSQIFLASDWKSKIKTLENLKAHAEKENPGKSLQEIEVSDLPGYRVGTQRLGKLYVFRSAENFIYVKYSLKGSSDQIEEGETALSSIEIRTGGIEYP